jgi:DNA repair exonuclease SbcCD ATPase subunit
MMSNVASTDAAEQLRQLRAKLRTLKNDEASQEEKYKKLSEDVGLLHSDIEKLVEDKKEFDDLIEQWRVFELFMQATSKNGIPLEIIRSRLPEINTEISSILQGVTGFTVELESDEGSNDMNIYINYGDSKRIIECCSGMEKMMSAMAIRVALTNVSELSKPDVLIIDEGFGSLDAGNIEACSRFLESLKKWFRCILIISHVDAIKDSVDNVLEIEKVGKDAKIIQK